MDTRTYRNEATRRPGSVFEELFGQDTRVVPKGKILRSEGDESRKRFYVSKGWLAVSKSLQDGDQQILEFILPGETYDPTGADGHTSFVEIEALCDSRIIAIDRTVWARLLREDPDLWEAERLRDIAAQARASERMLRLGKSCAETRIAYVLIELCLRLSACAPAGDCAFHVPLGQQQLGDFIGLSSVHVCRTLRRLSRQGIISTGDHMDIEIHDLAALTDLAGVDLADLRTEIIPGAA
ncbi:Crp/Fnr family transcriptional regulator [Roseovarius sp. D22-M7]|uniref:Crp/Fnr family transcriptional regulator n=1 Tax=Roseovarius sp. D22-M7 TaxID=3127116 RepID=UPI00301014A1